MMHEGSRWAKIILGFVLIYLGCGSCGFTGMMGGGFTFRHSFGAFCPGAADYFLIAFLS